VDQNRVGQDLVGHHPGQGLLGTNLKDVAIILLLAIAVVATIKSAMKP
jgi:hypothetical protein